MKVLILSLLLSSSAFAADCRTEGCATGESCLQQYGEVYACYPENVRVCADAIVTSPRCVSDCIKKNQEPYTTCSLCDIRCGGW